MTKQALSYLKVRPVLYSLPSQDSVLGSYLAIYSKNELLQPHDFLLLVAHYDDHCFVGIINDKNLANAPLPKSTRKSW